MNTRWNANISNNIVNDDNDYDNNNNKIKMIIIIKMILVTIMSNNKDNNKIHLFLPKESWWRIKVLGYGRRTWKSQGIK